MDASEIRRSKVQAMVDAEGLSVVAKKFKLPERQINDMLKKRKSFGEKIARKMEKNHSPEKQSGWLDISDDYINFSADSDLLTFMGLDRETVSLPLLERMKEFAKAEKEKQDEALAYIKRTNKDGSKESGEGTEGK